MKFSKIDRDMICQKNFRLNAKNVDCTKLLENCPKMNAFWSVFFVKILILILWKDFEMKSGNHR